MTQVMFGSECLLMLMKLNSLLYVHVKHDYLLLELANCGV